MFVIVTDERKLQRKLGEDERSVVVPATEAAADADDVRIFLAKWRNRLTL